jgi:hypothetical protein
MAFEFKKYTESEEVKKAKDKASEYDTYTESQAVGDYRNKLTDYEANNNPGEWKGGTYGDAVKEAWNNINNRTKFSYDLNGDALYQQYKDKYINQGRLAMADTIGQASAMTGGYGSSYAVTAGNQAYQSHLQNLNDIVPQLYQMAYDRYNQEGQDLKDKYSILNNMYQTEYGEHRDKVSDFNTTLGRLTDAYNTERAYDRGVYESDRTHYTDAYNNLSSTEYARHNTEQTNAFNAYQQSVNEEIQRGQLAISQEQLKLQKEAAQKAAETDSFEGLSFDDSEKLKAMYEEEDWDSINRYIASLNLSSESTKQLAEIWLPESYRNPLKGLAPTTDSTNQFKNRFNTVMKN